MLIIVCPKHVFMLCPDSSSICSEGSVLQCIFILLVNKGKTIKVNLTCNFNTI